MSLPPKWCVMLIHASGGSASRVRDSADEAVRAGVQTMLAHPGVYVCATPAYEIGEALSYPGIYDTSVPDHALAAVDPKAVALYRRVGE